MAEMATSTVSRVVVDDFASTGLRQRAWCAMGDLECSECLAAVWVPRSMGAVHQGFAAIRCGSPLEFVSVAHVFVAIN